MYIWRASSTRFRISSQPLHFIVPLVCSPAFSLTVTQVSLNFEPSTPGTDSWLFRLVKHSVQLSGSPTTTPHQHKEEDHCINMPAISRKKYIQNSVLGFIKSERFTSYRHPDSGYQLNLNHREDDRLETSGDGIMKTGLILEMFRRNPSADMDYVKVTLYS